MFKRSKKSFSPRNKVYMPVKKNDSKIVKRKKSFRDRVSVKKSTKKRGKRIEYGSIVLYFVISVIFVLLLYISARFIISMRSEDVEDGDVQYVVGLNDIPVYPDSIFIFSGSIDELSVANFIGSGNSAYRLPFGSSISDVFDFYSSVLPDLGWNHVLSVEVGSDEMRYGEYWVKDGRGMRIYSKFNDVWYEVVSQEEALSGMRGLVEKEVERNLLLVDQDYQDFLPDFSWVLPIPKEYIVSYSATDFEKVRSAELKRLGSDYSVRLTPVGYSGKKVLDNYLRDYTEMISSQEEDWVVTNTTIKYTNYGGGLSGIISSNVGTREVLLMPNTYDSLIYVFDGSIVGDPFFEYVVGNIEPQGLSKD